MSSQWFGSNKLLHHNGWHVFKCHIVPLLILTPFTHLWPTMSCSCAWPHIDFTLCALSFLTLCAYTPTLNLNRHNVSWLTSSVAVSPGYGRVSSLDLLSVSGLVNYFGKWTDLTHVEISPLLMRKGATQLALYGLSHLKDERLARLFGDYNVSSAG